MLRQELLNYFSRSSEFWEFYDEDSSSDSECYPGDQPALVFSSTPPPTLFTNEPRFSSLPALINTVPIPTIHWKKDPSEAYQPPANSAVQPSPLQEEDSSEASPDDIPRNTRVMDSLSSSEEEDVDVSWRESKEIPITPRE
jgi:hypothetical protein